MYVSRPADVKRARELDKKATALGRKLVKGLETDDEEDDYDDESDMEFLGIVFSPVKRYLAHIPFSSSGRASVPSLVQMWVSPHSRIQVPIPPCALLL